MRCRLLGFRQAAIRYGVHATIGATADGVMARWPFAFAALRGLRCSSGRLRGLAGFHPRACSTLLDRYLRGPHRQCCEWEVSFSFAAPLAFLPPFLRSISCLLGVLPSAPKGGWRQSPRCLSSGFPKIAPPSVVPASVNSPPWGSLAFARGPSAFGAGSCLALSRLRSRASRSCSDLAV